MMWTYEIDGKILDIESDYKDIVQEFANKMFEELCIENEVSYCKQPITLIGFEYDENQDKVIIEKIPSEVEYQYEPSMRSQHGNP